VYKTKNETYNVILIVLSTSVQVVTREAIYYGLADCSFNIASLVGWALPYAQRYFCSVHPDKYIQLKQSGFDILNRLQVIVVEKLYYRNVIKSCGGASKKRVECSCLLQVCDGSFIQFSLSLSLSHTHTHTHTHTLKHANVTLYRELVCWN
jgi:hypothetical protein